MLVRIVFNRAILLCSDNLTWSYVDHAYTQSICAIADARMSAITSAVITLASAVIAIASTIVAITSTIVAMARTVLCGSFYCAYNIVPKVREEA